MLAKLAIEAGLPPGVLGIIHGTHDCVNFICDAPEIKYVHTPTHSTGTGFCHVYTSVRLDYVLVFATISLLS